MNMRLTLARIATASVFAACAFALTPVVQAQTTGTQGRFDVNLKDADMKVAVDFLVRKTGLSIVFEASEKPFPPISVNLNGVTGEEALRYICTAAGAYYRVEDNGVYIISATKPEDPKTTPVQDTIPAIPEKKKLYKIKLQHGDARAIYLQLTKAYVWDSLDTLREINQFKDTAHLGDKFNPVSNIYNSSGGQVNTFQITPRNTNQPVQPTNGASASDIILPGESAMQGSLGGGLGQGGGAQGGGGQGAGAGGGQLTGNQGLIPNIDYITFDPNDNSIVIRATEQQWRDLQQYVDQFDIAPKQVTIKVQFVTTSSSQSKSLGFDWLYTRGTQAVGNVPGSFAKSGDPIFLSWQSGNIQTRLRTFLQDGYGRTVSSPIVRTLNNELAQVSQGIQSVIFVPQVITNGQVSSTVYVPQTLPAFSTLAVRPRINEDGTVTMSLNMPIQQFGQIRRSPDGTFAVPDVSTQFISLTARVKSGDTIVLAGFTQRNDQSTTQKFPVLGDLPIIGQLFRSSSKDLNSSELLVFVTPVIEDPETSGGFGG